MKNDEADDDQNWLDLMAGRSVPQADASTRAQAGALRAALLKDRLSAPAGAPAAADERAERLLQRARAAGVLENRLASPARPARPANRWPYAVAASVGLVGMLMLLQQQQLPGGSSAPDEPEQVQEQMRGAALQQRPSSQTLQDRQALLERLRDAGFDAQPYERLGRQGIDVELPVPLPADRAAALKQLGLQPAIGSSLQIEFLPPAPASTPASP